MLGERWTGAPRALRWTVLLLVVALGYGTVVHVVQLLGGGFRPYSGSPIWVQVYFTALTVLDPLAAVLLARCRRSGVLLTATVFVTDAIANGYANHVLDDSPGLTAGRVGQALISVLALASLAAAPAAWRRAADRRPSRVSGVR